MGMDGVVSSGGNVSVTDGGAAGGGVRRKGFLRVSGWDFRRALGIPPISSPIHARYWRCLLVGWHVRKRWLR